MPSCRTKEDASAHFGVWSLRGGRGRRRLASPFAGRCAAPPPARRSGRPRASPQGSRISEQVCRPFRAHATGPWKLVRRVAAQGDEVRHLLGLHAVAVPPLPQAPPAQLAHAAGGLKNRRPVARQLQMRRGLTDPLYDTLFLSCATAAAEKVVGLVALTLAAAKPKDLTRSVQGGPSPCPPVRRLAARRAGAGEEARSWRRRAPAGQVPADECGTRRLSLPEAHEEIGEADECVAGLAFRALHRLGQRGYAR